MLNLIEKCDRGCTKFIATLTFIVLLLAVAAASVGMYAHSAFAETDPLGGWYRLRTNNVPYRPSDVIVDAEGGIWISAFEGTEYDPGVWYHAPADPPGTLRYITNSRKNNALGDTYLTVVEKPDLVTAVRCALKDAQGNIWYGLANRKVLCERPDGTVLTFTMQDTSDLSYGVETANVDSVHRIRLIDRADGAQDILLISARGIIRIDS